MDRDKALLQGKIEAWRVFLRELGRVCEEVLALPIVKTDLRKSQELRIMLRGIDKHT